MGSVIVFEGGKDKMPAEEGREDALKRIALLIASELPKDTNEAYRVLEYAKTLVGSFLAPTRPF